MSSQLIEDEISRLRRALDSLDKPSSIDAAVIEALASQEVQDLLDPILNDGARLTGSTLSAAGSLEGVALITFETAWNTGLSRLGPPSRVNALMELSPPKLLRAGLQHGGEPPQTHPFTFPVGPVPPTISGAAPPSVEDVMSFRASIAKSTEQWLERQSINTSGDNGQPTILTYRIPGSTGSSCSSLLCFERYSDDDDYRD